MNLLTVKRPVISDPLCIQARRSWLLRAAFHGLSEEAGTRGFPSPPFGGFGFIVATANYSRKLSDCSRVYLIWIFSSNRQCRLWVVISISRCNTFTNVNGISQFALLCPRAFERSPKLQKQAKYHYDQNGSDRENKGHHWRHRYTFDRPKVRCAR